MKHLWIQVVLFTTVTVCLNGQSAFDLGKFHVGIKGGFNTSAVFLQQNYGQTEMDYKLPVSPVFGISMQWRFSPKSYIVGEVAYQPVGLKHEDRIKRMDFYKKVKLDYLAVPIMYKLVLGEPASKYERAARYGNNRFYLLGGIQPAWLISAESRYTIDGQQTDFVTFITEGGNPNEEEIVQMGPPANDEELYNDFDISLVGGGGMFLRFQPRWIVFVEIRGGIGLTDINADKWRLPGTDKTYSASRNLFAGLHAGVVYAIF